jgi:oligosaccharide repeat unit polymerase
VLYLLSFLISYLLFLPNHEKLIKIPCLPENRFVLALLILFCVFSSFLLLLNLSLGLKAAPTYGSESMYIAYEALSSLPLILRQAYGLIVSNGMILIVQISLLLALFLKWKNKVYRYILYLWLFLLLITNILFMGNRTTFILIFIASILMYNQFVKPLNLIKALALALFLLCTFFMIGIMRGGAGLAENVQ